MSKAHVEKFGEVLLSDPDMSEKLGLSKFLGTLDAKDSDAQIDFKATFVDNAVKEAASRGLIFSKEEFLTEIAAVVEDGTQTGELSEAQLENVAAGNGAYAIRHPKSAARLNAMGLLGHGQNAAEAGIPTGGGPAAQRRAAKRSE